MDNSYTAIIKKEGQWWIGWILEIPGINCQEKSQKKLLESLKIALQEALQLNGQEALIEAGNDYKEEKIVL
jgi:predicted RNase H-like HicB family nuclease